MQSSFSKRVSTLSVAIIISAALLLALLTSDGALTTHAQTGDTPIPEATVVQEDGQGIEDLLPASGKLNPPQYPNLDSHLSRIVEQVQTGQFTAQAAAANAPFHREDFVAVTLYTTEGYAQDVWDWLDDNSASPRNIGIDYIEAYVQVSLLPSASEREGVISVRKIVPLRPAQGRVVSEGVAAHGVPAWHAAGLKGRGIRIGIIDTGFEGFQRLMGTELPAAVEARCYTDIGVFTPDLADCENYDAHGTAVAEAVFDIAPEATYYISNLGSGGDLKDTVEWMVEHDVDVINVSAGTIWDGPGDGTSPFSDSPLRSVDAAVAGGITWVSAAGNEATTTWFGDFSDPDGDGFHNFSADSQCNQFEIEGLIFGVISAQLRWDDDWTGASRDLDLLLYEVLPSGERELVTSLFLFGGQDFQEGLTGDVPHEHLTYGFASSGTYCLAVESFSGALPEWIQLQVLTEQELAAHTLSGSITNPAESANPGLLAVGAAGRNGSIDNPFDTGIIEPFSSQGPTPDGRPKPDIVGADGGQSATLLSYGIPNGYFLGTSQASPHVAGLAALVKQNYPSYTPQQITNYLKTHAEERGAAGTDNVWGHGFARLLATDASTQPTPTPSPTSTPTPTPSVTPSPTSSPTPEPTDPCMEEFTGSATFNGTWTSDCDAVDPAPDGSGDAYALFYTFTLAGSADITVTLESSEDTYLNIRQGAGKDGAILHFNDDHDINEFSLNTPTDSGISASLAAGDYTIEATTYESETTGNFTLTVEIDGSTTPPPPPTPTPTPTPPGGGSGDGVCRVDLVVSPGESCTYPSSTTQFIVSGSGTGRIEHIASGDSIDIRVVLRAAKQSGGGWLIEEVGDSEQPTPSPTPSPTPTPSPSPTPTPSPTSTPISGAAPGSPANQGYVWQGSAIVVSWDAVSGADYYKIYHDQHFSASSRCHLSSFGSPIHCSELVTNVTATSYTHTSPDEDENYYWVVACNSAGCSDIDSANPASFVDTRPASPSNQRYIWQGSTTVVSWDAVSGADYYNIYYDDFFDDSCRLSSSGRPSFCEELATNVTATSYIHTDPDEDDNYYWVVACNSDGCSDIDSDNPAEFVDTRTGSPSNQRYAWQDSTTVVSWDAVSGADYYNIYYHYSFDSDCRLSSFGNPIFCEEMATNVTATSYTHTDPDEDATNYYWVVACNSGGCSDIDSDNPARLEGSVPVFDLATSVYVVDRTSNSLTVRWFRYVGTHEGAQFELQRSTSPDSGYNLVASNLTGNEHQDGGLSPNTTYYYRIRGCNEVGCSPFSDAKGGITESDGPVDIPSSPTGIQGRKVDVSFGTDYAIVTWNAVQGATYYQVYKNSKHDRDVSAPQTRYEDHEASFLFGFRGGTYTVRACNKAGCSAPTSGVTVLSTSR